MGKKKKFKLIDFVIFLTSVLTFFLLWVFFADEVKESYVNKIWKTWNSVEQVSGFWKNKNLDLGKFWQVYDLISKNYYWVEKLKKEDLVDWAISWMVESMWDKHSEFFNIKETKSFNEMLSWDFEWIGAFVEKMPLWIKIERIVKGSPAKKYWLKAWDIIIKANDVELVKLSLYDAVNKIKWPAWTKVILEILRAWEKEILKKEVVREKIKIPSVETKSFSWSTDIWYIALNIYWDKSAEEFKKALYSFKNKKGIIIDLRDNWGWLLQSAVEILSEFIEPWKDLVTTKYKNTIKNLTYKSLNNWDIFKWKIVILINENSASASEITAGALREYDRAILVWKKTYWKWSVQEPFVLPDSSLVKITIAKWFTPKDKNIDWEGIKPDVEIDFEKQDYDFDECKKSWKCDKNMKKENFEFYDRQLETAKEVLSDFIKTDLIWITIWKFKKEETNSWTTATWSLEK